MVLIMPEAHAERLSQAGSTTAGLLSSIDAALAMGCEEDMSRVGVRVLGSYVIVEGLIESEECIPRIMEIVEEIAGKGHVSVRLFRQ